MPRHATATPKHRGHAAKIAIFIIVTLAIVAAHIPPAAAANAKLVAITFDDGPHATYTPMLLDGLKERGVKATFFLVGSMIKNKGHLLLRMRDEGHQIASHGWSHTSMRKLTDEQIQSEITQTADLITEITGLKGFMLRPPYGATNDRVIAAINLPTILWNVDPTNGKYPTPEATMTSRLISTARDGSIILLHDTNAANVGTALDSIDTLRTQGYEFVTLNELFRLRGITPTNGVKYSSAPVPDAYSYDESRIRQHWAATSIEFVKKENIIVGNGNEFWPNLPMQRSVAVTVLMRMATAPGMPKMNGKPLASNAATKPGKIAGFADVPVGQWYSQAVSWACSNGIVTGYSNSVFGTSNSVTREQFYIMLDRCREALGIQFPTVSNTPKYGDDARISPWALKSVTSIRKAGFASKNDIELFRPHDEMTRAEAAEMITWFVQTARKNP